MFDDRRTAGNLLFQKLKNLKLTYDIVFAIPRGGVVVGKEIAKNLRVPLRVVVVKKIGAPNNSELAIGAVASGIIYIEGKLAMKVGVDQEFLDRMIKEKTKEVEDREKRYKIRNPRSLQNKIVILTDDGIATGATVRAAIKYLKKKKAKKIILAVPVIAEDTYQQLKSQVNMLVALEIPDAFGAVGQFYKEFEQVSDKEVIKILSN
ncbi:phosphoribosyltransferase [Candidatus Gottesmanbacteria bacterium]|nr:phosphoribosyltransferase [Candidatus Gottesmanbacteria bacterium]